MYPFSIVPRQIRSTSHLPYIPKKSDLGVHREWTTVVLTWNVLLLKSIPEVRNTMAYAIVIVLSVVYTFLELVLEATNGNIDHAKNGREPNAGAAIFPGIPVIPCAGVLLAWLLNHCYPNLGVWTVLGLFALYLPCWRRSLRRLDGELQSLLKSSKERLETSKDDSARQIDS